MGRFTDLFQENQPVEEVFAPEPVLESVEVTTPTVEITELSAPEAVVEEQEIFSLNAKDENDLEKTEDIQERPVAKKPKKL